MGFVTVHRRAAYFHRSPGQNVDAGSLADSWRQQPGTPAFTIDVDVEARKAALAEADAGKIAEYRAQADEAARAWFA